MRAAHFLEVLEQFDIPFDSVYACEHRDQDLALGFVTNYLNKSLALLKGHRTNLCLAHYTKHAFINVVPDVMPDAFFIQFLQVGGERRA
jgi:hypothetical protein